MVQGLFIQLDKKSTIPLNRQIYEQIQKLIVSGTLQKHEALPPTRQLSEQLEISRSVVIQAYEQLQAEGYLIMKKGSGTFVADNTAFHPLSSVSPELDVNLKTLDSTLSLPALSLPTNYNNPPEESTEASSSIPFDFRHGVPAWDVFPMDVWQKSLVRTCRKSTPALLGYGPAEGSMNLRREIARLLRSSRSIPVTADQIVMTTGATQALDILARLLIRPGDQVVVEDPAHSILSEIFGYSGARVISVPVDREGLSVNHIYSQMKKQNTSSNLGQTKLIYVTPSHQFPLGVTMSLERRHELIRWAEREDAYIIEDDYDSEYRYEGYKLSALAGLGASERIIYVGSFSKILFPALRIGYAVLPRPLVQPFLSIKRIADRMSPSFEQEALADFISNGQYAKHVNQMGKLYAARRARLVRSLKHQFGRKVKIFGDQAGLHLLLEVDCDASEHVIASRSLNYGVKVYPAGVYFTHTKRDKPTFILGYSNLSEEQIDEGIQKFAQAVTDCVSRNIFSA
ncbi:GntR family transcriptional regulator/MocR family aminotransferase [Paenibacillus shirakamiensis]|uniref:GntR family transcriptional regulator/MocR family aminotransferase n=1 Tax=Paenibacillus shirakamiensis TaxID=1265935 RepID=A0ABS4JEZ8_9BACL|nr:PLP-dependent aminotransferase family protein [Paenibacillus shirakamiensis]MBP2000273.1 GntR family transcriptional regulator/MocR family aminotransferase [Paenibacillus shirakamiensis]